MSDDELAPVNKYINLHFSASVGFLELLKAELATSMESIDDTISLGWTPLMLAVRNGRTDIVKFLLESGADVTKKNSYDQSNIGANIFLMSVVNGNIEIMTIILQHMLQEGISRKRIEEFVSPIALAVSHTNQDVVKWLIAQNFDVNALTPTTNISPLMFAAASKNQDGFVILVNNGANKNIRNYMDLTCDDINEWRLYNMKSLRSSKQTVKAKEVETLPIVVSNDKEEHSKNPPQQKEREKTFTVSDNTPRDDFVDREASPKHLEEKKDAVKEQPLKQKGKKRAVGHLTLPNEAPHIRHIQQNHMPPYNIPFGNYVPLMASPYNIPPIGTPASPISPMMIPNPYQFMPATMEAAANSPNNAMSNNFTCPVSVPYFFPPQMSVNERMNRRGNTNNPYYLSYYRKAKPVSPNVPKPK